MPQPIKYEDIKTKTDVNRYLTEECATNGLQASLLSYITGIVVFPIVLHKFKRRINYISEYNLLLSAVGMMFISYSVGVYVKKKCDDKVKKELYDLMYKD